MEAIAMLINDIPEVMAPAFLVVGLLVILLIRAAIQFTESSFKAVAIGVMSALTAGMIMMKSVS
jgi:hypothetical protein